MYGCASCNRSAHAAAMRADGRRRDGAEPRVFAHVLHIQSERVLHLMGPDQLVSHGVHCVHHEHTEGRVRCALRRTSYLRQQGGIYSTRNATRTWHAQLPACDAHAAVAHRCNIHPTQLSASLSLPRARPCRRASAARRRRPPRRCPPRPVPSILGYACCAHHFGAAVRTVVGCLGCRSVPHSSQVRRVPRVGSCRSAVLLGPVMAPAARAARHLVRLDRLPLVCPRRQ
jgi:hypothetical protein